MDYSALYASADAESRLIIDNLRGERDRVRLAAEALGLGIFEWDLGRRVALAEDAHMHRLLGHGEGTFLGPEGVRSRVHRDDVAIFNAAIDAAAREADPWKLRLRVWRDADTLAMVEVAGCRRDGAIVVGAMQDASGPAVSAVPAPDASGVRPFRGGLSPEQFHRVVDHMARHLHEDVTLEQISKLAGFSPFHFQRAFKRQTGHTPQGYLLRLRVQHAKNLLFGTPRTLADIAHEVGYGTAQAFARAFSRVEGASPAEFRRRMRD